VRIAGIQKLTLVDFPETLACTIFTQGCPFRCGFCHNPELVLPDQFNKIANEEDIFYFLSTRIGKIEGVCITGGEPLLQRDILECILLIKAMGFKIKIDTNGFYPTKLKEIIQYIDYVAMDIKSSPKKYSLVTNTNINISNIQESINIIMESGKKYEFRTTICHPLFEIKDFIEIGHLIKGAEIYIIQNFVHSKHINNVLPYTPFTDKEIQSIKEVIKPFVNKINIR